MPEPGRKTVTVLEQQWNAIHKLVQDHPYIAGNSVAEFYRIAAQERLLNLIHVLKLPSSTFLLSAEDREKIRRRRARLGLPPLDEPVLDG